MNDTGSWADEVRGLLQGTAPSEVDDSAAAVTGILREGERRVAARAAFRVALGGLLLATVALFAAYRWAHLEEAETSLTLWLEEGTWMR